MTKTECDRCGKQIVPGDATVHLAGRGLNETRGIVCVGWDLCERCWGFIRTAIEGAIDPYSA